MTRKVPVLPVQHYVIAGTAATLRPSQPITACGQVLPAVSRLTPGAPHCPECQTYVDAQGARERAAAAADRQRRADADTRRRMDADLAREQRRNAALSALYRRTCRD